MKEPVGDAVGYPHHPRPHRRLRQALEGRRRGRIASITTKMPSRAMEQRSYSLLTVLEERERQILTLRFGLDPANPHLA